MSEKIPIFDAAISMLPPSRQSSYQSLLTSVTGSTALHRLTNISIPNRNQIFLKLEYNNLGGVHHSRIYPLIFARAESLGFILPGKTPVIEASAGGAAIAFAHCANFLGYNSPQPPQVVVPSYISRARLSKLENLNATIHKVPPSTGRDLSIHYLEKILSSDKEKKGGKIGTNPERLYCCTKIQKGTEVAYETLADESCKQLATLQGSQAKFDYFIGCAGSGSSISGVGKKLKEENYDIIDDFIPFTTDQAKKTLETINQSDSLSIGLTTAAAVSIALDLAKNFHNKNILTIAYDSYEQSYLSESNSGI